MAKLKKTARPSTAKPAGKPAGKASARKGSASKLHAAFNPKSITESAQQIWLAGMGAFTRAQSEGGKLFETLVRDGLSLEQTARKFAGSRAGVMRDAVEGRVDQARERAADTWDKLEKVFEERVQRALVKLGVPGRDDLNALTQRVERLTAELRKTPAPRKPAAPKTAAKPAPKASRPASTKQAKPSKPARSSKPAKAVKPRRTSAKPAAAVDTQAVTDAG
ncbi:MAG: phasin family protein [Xanthomonadaceae bacterium]|nr:phasin family protein [Xanthomonadaceae bacterium]